MLRQSRVMVVDDDAETLGLAARGRGQGGIPGRDRRGRGVGLAATCSNAQPGFGYHRYSYAWYGWAGPAGRGAREGAGCPW